MFRAVNDYLAKLNIRTDDDIRSTMEKFLVRQKSVKDFSINVNYNRYVVDITLNNFSVKRADTFYRKFEAAVTYPYSHISVRYNEDSRVRYRFATCRENKDGVYMDIIIK